MSQYTPKEDSLPLQESQQQQPPQAQQQQPQPEEIQQQKQPRYRKVEPRQRRSYDINIDAWYFLEINKRINEDPGIFKNYQINPFTKKTLDYVSPKITERRRQLPKDPCASINTCGNPNCTTCAANLENIRPLSEDDQQILKSYDLVKRAMDISVFTPKQRFCEPQTEAMRVGWFPKPSPPPTNLSCMYIKTCWSPNPCCYFHPKPDDEIQQNEMYDERFRAVHRMAEFIRTETKLKQFDAVMNPEGYRGKIITQRKRPSSLSRVNNIPLVTKKQ